ncbi:MAG: hypothetical protein LBI91_05570 [Spirochaetaceae bacterium]|jgi:hypothetical protein|nr:hypothetical protein [Spirochaetaceae bacterium]
MKLMVICVSPESAGRIAEVSRLPAPVEIIRYSQALKAMDNIEEIDPGAIIISACDFPRHWKTIVQYVRQERSKKRCPIIVLHGDNFDAEDAAKAYFIGVNAVVPDSLPPDDKAGRILDVLAHYFGTGGQDGPRPDYTPPLG